MTRQHDIRLGDRRVLTVAEFGSQDGFPVIYMHGAPGTGSEWSVFGSDSMLEDRGLRLLAPSRPGLGRSTYQAGRTVEGWVEDLRQVLECFRVGRFAILGYSGGAAYAVLAALAFEARLASLTLVAPVLHADASMTAGLDENGLRLKHLVHDHPRLGALVLALAMGWPSKRRPQLLRSRILRALPVVDRRALLEGRRLDRFVDIIADAFLNGAQGPSLDMALMASPWSSAPRSLSVATHIFQGELDSFGARPAMAQYLAKGLGTDDLRIYPEGHISIFTSRLDEILAGIRGES